MAIDYNEPLKPTPVKASRRRKPKDLTLEELLEAAKALGVSISIPSQDEELVQKKSSQEKLGIVSKKKPEPPQEEVLKPLRTVLHSAHSVSGRVFGPGEVTLEPQEADLFRTLVQQDQACVRGHMDMRQYQPVSRCFIIEEGRGRDQHNKFSKKEVSEAVFNSDRAFEENVAITASKFDIAGYQPSFGAETKPF